MDLKKFVPKNIIVRMPNWLGDAVMASPILTDLRRHYPDAKISILCQSHIASLFTEDKEINEVLTFQKRNCWLPSAKSDIVDPLRFGKYDLGILTTNSFSSAWWFWLGKVKNKIGYRLNWRRFLLDYPISFPQDAENTHLVNTYKKLLSPLGIPLSETVPVIKTSIEETQSAKELLATYDVTVGKHKIVGINPGAAFGTAKCWPPNRFKELTEKLIKDPSIRVVFFGDSQGKALVNQICNDLPDAVVNLSGKTNLRELIALISQCSLMLSNDSGPMHIAAALKVPLIALFGSTNDVKTGPYLHGTVVHKHVECSPCYQRVCPRKDFICMTRIQVEEIYQLSIKSLHA